MTQDQETQTTFNYVKYIRGGNNGNGIYNGDSCIHPLAFISTKWDMNYCDDGYIRPFVCDTTVPHHAVDEHDSRYDAIIEPWAENKVNHKWFPYGVHDTSKCLNCGRKVLNNEELKEANESNCEFE